MFLTDAVLARGQIEAESRGRRKAEEGKGRRVRRPGEWVRVRYSNSAIYMVQGERLPFVSHKTRNRLRAPGNAYFQADSGYISSRVQHPVVRCPAGVASYMLVVCIRFPPRAPFTFVSIFQSERGGTTRAGRKQTAAARTRRRVIILSCA